jgi:hypothetical protein
MYLSKKGVENIRRGLIRSWKPGGRPDKALEKIDEILS